MSTFNGTGNKRSAGATVLLAATSGLTLPVPQRLLDFLIQPARLEKLLQLDGVSSDQIFRAILSGLSIRCECTDEDRKAIPRKGPLLICANHPHGILDGLVIGSIVEQIRQDVKFIGHPALASLPVIGDRFIPLDPFHRASAVLENSRSIRRAAAWLKGGGAIVLFPAGSVSRYRIAQGAVADDTWSPLAAHLSATTGAVVTPVNIAGSNSLLFQIASQISPQLGTALLIRELLKKQGETVTLSIGEPIGRDLVARIEAKESAVAHLHFRSLILRHRTHPVRVTPPIPEPGPEVEPNEVADEIAALPRDSTLLSIGEYRVIASPGFLIPKTLQEIGRLREVAFQAVGEGSGMGVDVDRFDQHYQHLILWKADTMEIVGAYRLGCSDHILPTLGPGGLYTSSLFSISEAWWTKHQSALELGRAFIRADHQRNGNALFMLWRGIGAFLSRHPQYRYLFGPVSISDRYTAASRELIWHYYTEHAGNEGQDVIPRNPVRSKAISRASLKAAQFAHLTTDDLDAIVSDIEGDGTRLPVLIRQYAALGGKIVSFNVDETFSNSLDGFLVLDLLQADHGRLARYLGRQTLARVVRFQSKGCAA